MAVQTFNWKRFWCPRGSTVNLSEQGYLYDPAGIGGPFANPEVVPIEAITGLPCLVLLGEPGMGKTYAMRMERTSIDARVESTGGKTLWLDLRSYASEDRLVHDLFGHPVFLACAEGQVTLHVFLDSLDECLLRVNTLATLFLDELARYPRQNLYLRIACRTAEWPQNLEDGLGQLWGNENVGVFELAPLREADVTEAARAGGLDPNAFVRDVERMGIGALANRPVTLNFLLRSYLNTHQFPSRRSAVYFEGCRHLCEETNEDRRVARLTGALTSDERLIVAARIAAVSIFTNRYAVWTDIDWGDAPDEDVTVRELLGGTEEAGGRRFDITEPFLREVLTTGLFSSRGTSRLGWAHQTYAEFLAAWYLVQHKVSLTQMMSLIVHQGDPEGKLIPQLHETAAWLASMMPEVFREIGTRDVLVLLRSDVATADIDDRAMLVDALLREYDGERLLDRDPHIYRQYAKLGHPSLADQLRPYLQGSSTSIVARRAAIDIAEACELKSLQNELLDLALALDGRLADRVQAVHAVGRIADEAIKARLKPLALGSAGDDPDDELKGSALQAIWPRHLSAEELFDVLTAPQNESLFGAYALFLSQELPLSLDPAHLPHALRWVEEQRDWHGLSFSFQRLVDSIMLNAWANLLEPNVLGPFARAAVRRLQLHDSVVEGGADPVARNTLAEDDDKRRKAVETMVPICIELDVDPRSLVFSRPPLAISQDMPWLIEHCYTAKAAHEQAAWAAIINRVIDWRDSHQLELIFEAAQNSAALASEFAWLLMPVELDSPRAQQMKESHRRMQRWQEPEESPPVLAPPSAERVAMLLDECELKDPAAWWRLNLELTLGPESTDYSDELESDITALAGWKAADAHTRNRMVRAASRYLAELVPDTEQWLGTNKIHRPTFAGYRALRLLAQEDEHFLESTPVEIWQKWAPIVVAYPTSTGFGNEQEHRQLVCAAYRFAPAETIATLLVMLDKENNEVSEPYILRKFEGCWDDRLAEALLVKARDEKLKPEFLGGLLCELLDHQAAGARAFAEALVPIPPAQLGESRTRAIVAVRSLVLLTPDAGWPVVWPVITEDPEFGREVVLGVAHGQERHSASFGPELSEDQLAQMYVWLARQFPHHEDPQMHGAHPVGERESVGEWRDAILRRIQLTGTYAAVAAIGWIQQQMPELKWLKWVLLEAKNTTRRNTWMPPEPSSILEVAANPQARLVQSGDELLQVVIESLQRLETKLQSETPMAIFLWNELDSNVFRPKHETAFSNLVKNHLDDDLRRRGVVVNREVEIHMGERTDIHVDAVIRGTDREVYDTVTVIVEVKGCWHPELAQAMETQLVNRYLRDNHCNHGVYLVGWFSCAKWDGSDYRKSQAPKLSLDEARARFGAQAVALSQGRTRIQAFVMDTSLH